jgi:hypothetical protein
MAVDDVLADRDVWILGPPIVHQLLKRIRESIPDRDHALYMPDL